MKRRNYKKHELKAEMNVVPYIDVMLVLLVIFMVAAPLIHNNQAINIDLPKSEQNEINTPINNNEDLLPLILSVDKNGYFYLNWANNPNQPIPFEAIKEITEKTLKKHPNLPVFVQGDKEVAYEKVIEAIGYLQKSGAKKVGLVNQPIKDNK